MTAKKWLLGVLLTIVFSVVGCRTNYEELPGPQRDVTLRQDYCLPPGAKNIVRLDNDWHMFEMEIDGETHKFLRQYYGSSDGRTISLTEIRQR